MGVKKGKAVGPLVTLQFPDNRLLASLSGPREKHFARLEQKLDVRLSMRGNRVAIEGAARERAGAILSALYARAGTGEAITLSDVDAEIRFTDAGRAAQPDAIRTAAGRATRPRSPATQATPTPRPRSCCSTTACTSRSSSIATA